MSTLTWRRYVRSDYGLSNKINELDRATNDRSYLLIWFFAGVLFLVAIATQAPVLLLLIIPLMILYRVLQVARVSKVARLTKEIQEIRRGPKPDWSQPGGVVEVPKGVDARPDKKDRVWNEFKRQWETGVKMSTPTPPPEDDNEFLV